MVLFSSITVGPFSAIVRTDIGAVEIDTPRDRDASFDPQIVRKRQRRLAGVDDLVVSLSAKGLTTGEIAAHLAEVYGTSVSKETISAITDRVLEGLADWQNRPLDAVYPVIFIDAINVKIRDRPASRGQPRSNSLTASATPSGWGRYMSSRGGLNGTGA